MTWFHRSMNDANPKIGSGINTEIQGQRLRYYVSRINLERQQNH